MRRKVRTWIKIGFILGVVFLLGAVAYSHYAYAARIAKLRAQGEKVTFPELGASLSVLTNSMLASFTNAVSQLGEPPFDSRNFDAPYAQSGQMLVMHRLSAPPVMGTAGSNVASSWPQLYQALDARREVFTELSRTLKQPDVNVGPWKVYMESRGHFRPVRAACGWLSGCTFLNLRQNGNTNALACILETMAMADLHCEEYLLVVQMTRVAAARAGIALTWEALQARGWNDSQLAMLQRAWERLDLGEALERAMIGERSFGIEMKRTNLELFPSSPDSQPRNKKVKRLYLWTIGPNDLRLNLNIQQEYIELARAFRKGRPWPEISRSLDEINERINELSRSPKRFFYLFTLIATPNFGKAYQTVARAETERQLCVTAIALKRYELKYQKPPPDLAALVPEFLGAVPADCMSGQPLRYQIAADNVATLYSVGQDGEDDGGDASPSQPNGKPGLWEGHDAVWPKAAN
jgi:hypothetical protein